MYFLLPAGDEDADRAIVQGVIALAKAFDRRIMDEGVETEELFRVQAVMGCECGQGYGIARPMPMSEFLAWLDNWKRAPFS